MTPDINQEVETSHELRADAREVAEILKISPLVEKLKAAKAAGQTAEIMPRPLLNAKMLCLWKIAQCILEVRKMVAAIDYDLASSNVALDQLVVRGNNIQNMLNTFNFAQGGTLGIIKQSMSLHGMSGPAQYPGMTTFGLGTVLASLNLILPSMWVRRADSPPNTLSHFVHSSHPFQDSSESYLWQFLSSPIPGSKYGSLTRREVLIKHWEDFAGLRSANERLLRRLSSTPDDRESFVESIKLLNERLALLHDLKTHIEEFDGSLYELHKSISAN